MEPLEEKARELARKDIAAHIRGYVKQQSRIPSGIKVPVPPGLKKDIQQLCVLLDIKEPLETLFHTKREAKLLEEALIKSLRERLK